MIWNREANKTRRTTRRNINNLWRAVDQLHEADFSEHDDLEDLVKVVATLAEELHAHLERKQNGEAEEEWNNEGGK